MKKKLLILGLLFLAGGVGTWLFLSLSGDSGGALGDYFGVPPRAYKSFQFEDPQTKTLSYLLRIPYPAEPLYQFYNERLKRKGWKRMDWDFQGKIETWEPSIGQLASDQPVQCVFKYYAAWANETKDRMIMLNLGYYSPQVDHRCSDYPLYDELTVTLQELPYPQVPPPFPTAGEKGRK
jgi:hypothetical protein